jgi:hypothetical protein
LIDAVEEAVRELEGGVRRARDQQARNMYVRVDFVAALIARIDELEGRAR